MPDPASITSDFDIEFVALRADALLRKRSAAGRAASRGKGRRAGA